LYVPVNLIYKIIKYYCFEILELSSVQSFSKHVYVAIRTFYDILLLLTSYDMQLLLHNQEIWSSNYSYKKKRKTLTKNCRNSALRNKIVIRFEMNGKKKFRPIISRCKKLQIQPYLVGNLVIRV
jgi:hypothetical protein